MYHNVRKHNGEIVDDKRYDCARSNMHFIEQRDNHVGKSQFTEDCVVGSNIIIENEKRSETIKNQRSVKNMRDSETQMRQHQSIQKSQDNDELDTNVIILSIFPIKIQINMYVLVTCEYGLHTSVCVFFLVFHGERQNNIKGDLGRLGRFSFETHATADSVSYYLGMYIFSAARYLSQFTKRTASRTQSIKDWFLVYMYMYIIANSIY